VQRSSTKVGKSGTNKPRQSLKDGNRQSSNLKDDKSSNNGTAISTNIAGPETASSGVTGMVSEKEYKREKKLRKVLKEALAKEEEKLKQLEKDMERLRIKNEELENDNKEKESKYLDLYMENS